MATRYPPNASAGAYTIRRFINAGNFAISYEAEDSSGEKVFLKQYKSPSLLVSWYKAYKKHQDELKRRVTADAALAERTYAFIDMYEHKNAFIQVYGFIEGGKDLKAYLEEGAMSPAQRYTFASLLLYSLMLFHKAGIVHTDLKPDNVYLMPREGVKAGYNLKLIDFDFTVLDDKPAPWDKSKAADGQMYVGTMRYMSPEHLRNERPKAKSDVFTAAIMCYELLTKGGHPFPEDEDEYRKAALSGTFPHPDFIVPPDAALTAFGELLERALSPDIDKRPTVEELQQGLLKCRKLFTGGSRPAPPAPAPRPADPPKPTPPPPPPTPPPAPKAHLKLGLSMQEDASGAIDWFNATSTFGSRTSVAAVKNFRVYCNSCQFVLRRESDGWYLDPAPAKPKNLVIYNGNELTESQRLKDGDVIALGSAKDPSKRNICPMVVHLEEC